MTPSRSSGPVEAHLSRPSSHIGHHNRRLKYLLTFKRPKVITLPVGHREWYVYRSLWCTMKKGLLVRGNAQATPNVDVEHLGKCGSEEESAGASPVKLTHRPPQVHSVSLIDSWSRAMINCLARSWPAHCNKGQNRSPRPRAKPRRIQHNLQLAMRKVCISFALYRLYFLRQLQRSTRPTHRLARNIPGCSALYHIKNISVIQIATDYR